jgi:hypothetical protein
VKDSVVVQIRWGSSGRPGLRTLAVEGTSLDDVFHTIAASLHRQNGRAARQRTTVSSKRGFASRAPKDVAPGSDANGVSRSASITWSRELRGSRLGPSGTLAQLNVGGRLILVRLNGLRVLPKGARVEVEGNLGRGELYLAEVMTGSPNGRVLRLIEPIL